MLPLNIPQSVQKEPSDVIPNSYVQNCSECCYEKMPDGTPNIAGMLQRQMMTKVIDNPNGHFEFLECAKCPVHLSTFRRLAKTADGRHLYWKRSGKPLTENELLKLEEDDDCIELYCDIR